MVISLFLLILLGSINVGGFNVGRCFTKVPRDTFQETSNILLRHKSILARSLDHAAGEDSIFV